MKTAAAGVAFASVVRARSNAPGRDRLACNSWPFRAYFNTPELREFRDSHYPLLNQWSFPEFLADHFGIHNVEFLPQHFPDTEPDTIQKIKAGLSKAHSTCCNIMGVGFKGGVYSVRTDTDAIQRETDRWLGVAKALNCQTITIALSGKEDPDAAVAATNLAPVVESAQKAGVKILFHNDDMRRESAEILSAVITQLGRDKTGTCPDFGNFATKSAGYALDQLRILAPFASNICHAKDGIADNGVLYRDNFPASMQVMADAGFRGLYSLEFEGLGAPLAGVRNLMDQTEEQLRRINGEKHNG